MNCYRHIVFIEGTPALEPLDILDREGIMALANYLRQWETPAGPLEQGRPWGSSDEVHELTGGLVISVNRRLGYVGACRRREDD